MASRHTAQAAGAATTRKLGLGGADQGIGGIVDRGGSAKRLEFGDHRVGNERCLA
jgi:hypothetical protein